MQSASSLLCIISCNIVFQPNHACVPTCMPECFTQLYYSYTITLYIWVCMECIMHTCCHLTNWLIGCEQALTVLYNECMYGVCVCVCVCAFVFASAIINYNQYSFGECAICITYTRKSWSRNASPCLYMCVYNLLADFPCMYVQWIKSCWSRHACY